MEKENSKNPYIKLYTAIILLLVYIAVVSLPFPIWTNEIVGKVIDITLKVGYIIFAYLTIYRYELCKIKYGPDKNWKLLLLIPLIALTFSNWIFVWIFKSPLNTSINAVSLSLSISTTVVTVFSEELLFREIIHETLRQYIKKDYLIILISAGIFASMHFLNIFSGLNPLNVLAQVGYTFVLGLVLGLLKEKKAGLVALVIFHLLFNLLNNDLFSVLYQGDWTVQFVVTNVIVGAVVVLYGVGMYFALYNNSLSSSMKNDEDDKISDTTEEENN